MTPGSGRNHLFPFSTTYGTLPWKKALLSGAGSVFESQRSQDEEAIRQKQKADRLYKQIGHLQVQVDFLKEACDHFGVGVPEDELDKLR
ncbi:MAG: hypothetical protein ACFB21_08690 [Opitutales bacterium]